MTKRKQKTDSSSEPVPAEKPSSSSFTTPKKAKVEEEKEIIDLTMNPEFIDSAEGYDADWESSKPPSPLQKPKTFKSDKLEKKSVFTPPKGKLLEARTKPESRGTTATSSAATSETGDSYTYGKKRGRGFVSKEEVSSSDSEESD